MYQLQFINFIYDTTKLTHLEQTNINLFIGNWSNHQLQKSICIRHGDDTSHNQYHILFIDTAHQRIKFSSIDNEEIIYILDYDDAPAYPHANVIQTRYWHFAPIIYERLV
ncbi:cysteine protease inhibitor staphostatin B [Staphylococcus aureus]